MAPESNLRIVKLDASIVLLPNANLHNIEFAANAIRDRAVSIAVFML